MFRIYSPNVAKTKPDRAGGGSRGVCFIRNRDARAQTSNTLTDTT